MMKHILKQFDDLNLIETTDFALASYIFVVSVKENFSTWIKINKLYELRTDFGARKYVIDEYGHKHYEFKHYGFAEISEFKMYKDKEPSPYPQPTLELRNLLSYSNIKEQEGKLCFLEHPENVDEGEEMIYVIIQIDEDKKNIQICPIDQPEAIENHNYENKNIYLLDARYIVNRIATWQ